MSRLVPLPVALPLLGAAIALLLVRAPRAQRWASVAVMVATVTASVLLLLSVHDEGMAVGEIGGWPAPFGIVLAVDRFGAIMVVISALMMLAVHLYAVGQPGTDVQSPWFHPLYLVLASGVSLSLSTGDLFNLFVGFEMMLIASYVLITLGARGDQVRSGMTYVVINLLSSTLFLAAVGLTYAATGTVNMADLVGRLATLDPALVDVLSLLFLAVFGVKAAIFPLFFWLPDSYPTAPTPVTAIFAGLLTKVGVYTIIRTQTLLFPDTVGGDVLLWLAAPTMVVGVLGAIAQSDIKRILSFHIVSQIGYMIFGVALGTLAGLAGAVFFIAHQIVVKTTLFLVGGLVEAEHGTSKLQRLGGMLHTRGFIAGLYLVAAFTIAGIPPTAGFVGKLALVEAGFDADQGLVTMISLAVSLLTLFSMTKIWSGVFWGSPEEPPPPGPGGTVVATEAPPRLMVAATAATVAVSVGIAVFAGPLYELAEQAAADLLDPSLYVREVLGR